MAISKKKGHPRKEKLIIVNKVKRPRGRPRKNPLPVTTNHPKKRGRPRKNPSEKKYSNKYEEVKPIVPIKTGKILGYCPTCHNSICTLDNVNGINPEDNRKDVYFCYKCCGETSISSLLDSKPFKNEVKYKSKKEYLEDCLQLSDDHKIPMNTPEIVHHEDVIVIDTHTEE